jgi:hypothetical protein
VINNLWDSDRLKGVGRVRSSGRLETELRPTEFRTALLLTHRRRSRFPLTAMNDPVVLRCLVYEPSLRCLPSVTLYTVFLRCFASGNHWRTRFVVREDFRFGFRGAVRPCDGSGHGTANP